MILTRLTLKDFGGHKNLELASTARTVGILGPNGSGKSTVLAAINFLLTGETEDAQETYVRAGCDNGSGDLTFQKNGMTGRIFRQIGKTPKRRLEWDGRIITKAAEVDETLGALFGADKKAVSSAVFIAQGDLQNILFGTQAEREMLFIRLVNLAFCDQRAKMLEGKIKKISLTVQDLGAVMDQTRLEVQRTQLCVDEANTQLALLPDFSTEIARLDERISLTQQITEVGRCIQEVNARRLTAQENLRGFLAAHGLSDVSTLVIKGSAIGLALAALHKQVDDTRQKIESVRLLRMKDGEVARQQEVFDASSAKQAASMVPADDQDRLVVLDREIQGRLEYNRLAPQVQETTTKLKQAEEKLATLVDPGLNPQIAALSEAISTQRSLLDQTKRLIEFQQEITKCLGKVDPANSRCRECGLKINADQDLDPTKLAEYRTILEKGQQDLTASNAQLREFGQRQAAFTSSHTMATRDCQVYRRDVESLAGKLAAYEQYATIDIKAHGDAVVEINNRKRNLDLAKQERTNAYRILCDRQAERAHYLTARIYADDPNYTNEKLIGLIGQRDALTAEDTKLKTLQTEAAGFAAATTEIGRQLQQLISQEETLGSRLSATPGTAALDQVLRTFNGQADLAKKELVNRQAARDTQLGVVKQAEQGQHDIAAKLKELQGRVAQDQKKLDCIAKLQEMKALLSRSGLPGQYVAHRFQQLAGLTQQHLGKLNANFLITTDLEVPLSFRFCRTDNGVDLPMTKMSGGQQVRLCLAFLMAVQTALVPDVGLLVLDEPSLHLDTEGKESLAELLRDAGQRLSGGESQIWAVDHAMELAPAFGSVLNLG